LICGIIGLIFGTLWGLYHWIHLSHLGLQASTGTVMIAVLPIMIGLQLIMQAMAMEINNIPRDIIQFQDPK
jgi:dolichol-phosphate mannosyltransferase